MKPYRPQPSAPEFGNRARAAMLAHACGDRFGAPLEFVTDASVRTRHVQLGNWTDDTHMSLYLGEAILAHGPGSLQPDRFGAAVGDSFVHWLHDPLTPSTAPGNTCMAGVRNMNGPFLRVPEPRTQTQPPTDTSPSVRPRRGAGSR